MKKILSFLSYHNAVPAALVVLALGAGSAFAATSAGVLPLPSLIAQPAGPVAPVSPEPDEVDPSTLLSANLDAFDFHPTITGVVETDTLYTVSYSIRTLAPEGSEWTASRKTGEFSVAKESLPDGGLNAYVVGKLRDIENGERLYLTRAQTAEKTLADARQARPSSAFAALIGLALDQIPVPVVEKPVPEPMTAQQPLAQKTQSELPAESSGTSVPEVKTEMASTTEPVIQTATSTDATSGIDGEVSEEESDITATATSTPDAPSPVPEQTGTTTPSVEAGASTTEQATTTAPVE